MARTQIEQDAAAMPTGRTRALTWLALLAILILGGSLRFFGLTTWDEPSFRLHPDERFLVDVASLIRLPDSPAAYFDSTDSPLNPRNNGKDFFVYGLLPQTLTRLTAVMLTPVDALRPDQRGTMEEWLPRPPGLPALLNPDGQNLTGFYEIFVVGRAWSAIFDMVSLVLVALIGRLLYGRRVALLAALLLAVSVLPIQLAHFFTVDSATACFVLLAIYAGARIARGAGAAAYVGLGLAIGAAMACRITLATLGLVGIIATAASIAPALRQMRPDRAALQRVALLVLAGLVALCTYRTLSPDAFLGTRAGTPPVAGPVGALDPLLHGAGWFDMRPDPRFLTNMRQISQFASGEIDWPPTQQWANRPRFVFALQNMIVWGMGLPLGLAAWAGWALAGWALVRRRQLEHLIPWTWVSVFFAWQGGQLLMSMRYYALLYGLFALFAAWALVRLWRWRTAAGPGWPGRVRRTLAIGVPLVVVLFSIAWAHAFTRIYSEPHSRIAASRWIYANVPPGATISSEIWDDGLPLGLDGRRSDEYVGVQLAPYAEDEPVKYDGSPGQEGMLDQLDRIDYLILSSNRVYDSVSRLPMRFPAINNFYRALFTERLGFTLVADISSYPTLFGVPLNDQGAEEAFSVYDHPRVLIYRKTSGYRREAARALITEGVAWGEIQRLPTVEVGRMPTALRLTGAQWPEVRDAGTWRERFHGWLAPAWAPWLPWLLLVQLIGAATFVALFRWLPMLPDRGYSIARTVGLLVIAYVAWLGASLGADDGRPWWSFDGTTLWSLTLLLVAVAAALGWRQRTALAAFVRLRRSALLSGELVFLGLFAVFLLIRAANPDLWHPARGGEKPMDLALLTAVSKSTMFPPYDPWFAGGYLNYYYFGYVMIGTLVLLTGAAPAVAYNLAIPTLAGLIGLGAFGAAYNLLAVRDPFATVWHAVRARLRGRPAPTLRGEGRAIAAGLLATGFVVIAGNLAQAWWLLPGSAPVPDAACGSSYAAQQMCAGRAEWAFWDATRVTGMALGSGEINEFPFFTLLFGDLHAHLMALPLMAAVLVLSLALVRAATPLPLVLLALLSGALYATNTWDYPVATVLGLLALGIAGWRHVRRHDDRPRAALGWIARAMALVGGGIIAFAPFRQWFVTDYAGLERWTGAQTPVSVWLLIHGLWLFLGASGLLWVWGRRGAAVRRWVPAAAAALAGIALAAVVVGGSALPLALTLLAGGIASFVVMIWRDRDGMRLSAPTLLGIAWGVAALGLAVLSEVAVARGDIGRMNTVFKLGMSSWMLFAVAAAGATVALWSAQRAGWWWIWRGIVLLGILGALAYPLSATPARLADRYDSSIAPTLDGAAYLRSPRSGWSEQGQLFALADDWPAIEWMQRTVDGTPIILEAHGEGYRWNGRFAHYTGLPTLLGWPWHQQQQRSVAQIDPVIASRQMLVDSLYRSTAGGELAATLQRYGIEYVVVGALERALYGDDIETRFGAAGLGPVFRGATSIWQVPPGDTLPAVVVDTRPVRAPPDQPRPAAMLPWAVGSLPAAHQPGWNTWAAGSLAATLVWLLVWYGLAALGLPITTLWFGPRWAGSGLAFARLAGLLLLGYMVWLPVSGRWWSYDTAGLALGVVASAALALALTARIGAREGAGTPGSMLRSGWQIIIRPLQRQWRTALGIELGFLGAFAALALTRALNPDLWHPIWGGEKPFEFGILNGVLRSAVLPPYSPFFADGTLNYYYYGFFLVSLPLRLSGIPPEIGFNLAVATCYGLLVSGVATLVFQLTRRWWAALVGVFAVALAGNLAAVVPAGYARGLAPAFSALGYGLDRFGAALGDWFIGPTRVIPSAAPTTINEFPAFTMLFADLHPHLIALPLTVAAIALTYALVVERRVGRLEQVTAWIGMALLLGTLAVTNSWDMPTYALVLGGAAVIAAHAASAAHWRARLWQVVRAGLATLLAAAGGLLAYLAFFQQYRPMVSGVGIAPEALDIRDYLLVFGTMLVVIAPLIVVRAFRAARGVRRPVWIGIALAAVVLLVLGAWLPGTVGGGIPGPFAARWWLAGLAIAVIGVLLQRGPGADWFGLWLAGVALLVSLGVDLVYIRDHLDGGDAYRMNTVFKFGLQAWVLFAIAVAALLPAIAAAVRRAGRPAVVAGVAAATLLGAIGAAYPLIAVPSRVALRFERPTPWSLDGLAFLKTARYTLPDYITPAGAAPIEVVLAGEYDAIEWLRRTVVQPEVVLQSSLEFYRAYGVRIAANTGFPTIVSPLHESEQRDGAAVAQRDRDVATIYRSDDADLVVRLLARYRVAYVVVGPVERAAYDGIGALEQLVGQYLTVAHRNEHVTVYRTTEALAAVAPLAPVSPGAVLVRPAPEVAPEPLPADGLLPQDAPSPPSAAIDAGDAFARAQQAFAAGDSVGAEQILAEAARVNPNDIGLHHFWGDVLVELGSYDAAVAAYRRAAEVDPSAGNFTKLGQGYERAGDDGQAAEAYRQSIAIDATASDAYFFLGALEERAGRAAAARDQLRRYLDTAPGDGQYREAALTLLEGLGGE